ncbi:MAG: hypothetical protein QM578_25085 [Pantoea sp.]|uniref:Uncharacterized protein n=1 Tax=Pantoea phytobeneficialis TaxID=2052056 RepID=A0AAP9KSD2_9GAMM|nr:MULTISPECIES: hypothetical protein [Pantoea]ERK08996.1 hypothetical protein L579_1363 [Pantoea sp. AS-PWVM4]MDO6407021.1 hypothetical protein [Pantoea phytobeneficialis]QGR09985.1 hypothetical protein CTZ24_26345 [Pantoea phytobeneficialis]
MGINGFVKHGQRHHELVTEFEQVNALLHQLMDGMYSSLDVYLNNCNHLREQVNRALSLLKNREFTEYLIQNDVALYYNLQSVMLAVQLLKNLLDNLTGTMKRSLLETS